MQIDLSDYDESRISQVLCVLLKHNIKNVKIETQLEDSKQKKSLVEKLRALKLVHTFTDKVSKDEKRPRKCILQKSEGAKFIFSQKDQLNTANIAKETTNPDQLFYLNHLLGESELIKIARDYKIDVVINSEKMILSGAKSVVERIMNFVSKITCANCESINFETHLCLRSTKYLNKLINKYELKIALRQDQKGGKFWLSLYGNDRKSAEECSKKVEEAAKKIILLKFDENYQSLWDPKEFLEYLKRNFRRRLKEALVNEKLKYEVNIVEHKYLRHPILYIFLDCSTGLFHQIRDWAQDSLKLIQVVRYQKKNLTLWQYYADLMHNKLYFGEINKNFGYFYGKKKHIKRIFKEMPNSVKHKIGSDLLQISPSKMLCIQRDESFFSSERSLVLSKGCFYLNDVFEKARWRSHYKKLCRLDKDLYTIRRNKKRELFQNESENLQSSHIVSQFLKRMTPEMWDLLRQNYHNFSLIVKKIFKNHALNYREGTTKDQSKNYSRQNKLYTSIGSVFDKHQGSYSYVWMDVFCWNARSLQKTPKFDYLKRNKADIQLVQEIWSPPNNMLSTLQSYRFMQREGKKGGGTLINLTTPKLSFRKEFPVDIDTKLYKLRVFSQRSIWVASVYLNQGRVEQVVQLFTVLRQIVPHDQRKYILMAGDWNIDLFTGSHKLKVLKSFCQEFGLQLKCSENPTRITSALDFVAVGSGIDVGDIKVVESISDHKAIRFTIRLPSI